MVNQMPLLTMSNSTLTTTIRSAAKPGPGCRDAGLSSSTNGAYEVDE